VLCHSLIDDVRASGLVEKPIEREIRIIDLIRRINLDDGINYVINERRKTLHTIG
jgi:hypothetical protein